MRIRWLRPWPPFTIEGQMLRETKQASPGSGLHFSEKKNHTYRLVQLLHLNAWLGLNSADVGKS